MPQPPHLPTVAHVLDRAAMIHGPETAELLAEWLADDWREAAGEGPAEHALHAAGWQLCRAAALRASAPGLANMVDHLAEACIQGWRQELTVLTTAVEDVP